MNKRIVAAGALAMGIASLAQGQSTAFTYQGELQSAGQTASGTYDMRFRLFDVAVGGVQIGSTICVDNVQVNDGRFVVSIDFGQQFATTSARYIELQVRPDTGLNCVSATGYTTLATRQLLTATPFATQAKAAFTLSAADGTPANAVFVDNNGKVGIGTTSPTHWVHVAAAGPTIALQDTSAALQQVGYISYRDNTNTERAWVGYGTAGSPDFSIVNARSGGDIVLSAFGGGRVGIGTSTPAAPLHVLGAIQAEAIGDQADLLWFASERSWVFRQQGVGSIAALKLQSIGGGGNKNFLIDTTGFVGIGTLNPQAKLDVAGTCRAQVIEITGADLAEKFPASEELEPGTVVAIDREHAGKLCMARGEYNRCVAGVVSGANNFSVGAVLGNRPEDENAPAVALSGRVYVKCDATTEAIEPGDLLTTSSIPGHAMKATDLDRSHGAVIGKAMEPLDKGDRGLILVLINLQ